MSTRSLRLLFGALVVLLTACATPAPVSEITPTATVTRTPAPSATPSPTQTATRAPTRTRTPTETPTPRPTNTPLPPPTFTPATPLADANRYRLVAWNAARASELILLIQQNAILNTTSFWSFPDYQLANSVVIVQSEGLRRFDSSPAAADWRWSRAYHLALGDNPHAGDVYANLIASSLNSQETDINNLSRWLKTHQAKWSLSLSAVRVPQNYKAGYLVRLEPEFDELGGSCILILQAQNGWHTFVAQSGYGYTEVEKGLRRWLSCGAADLTGDGIDEVIAGAYAGGRLGFSIETVYDLNTLPPTKLLFGPNGPDYVGDWLVEPTIDERGGEMQFYITRFLFPCHTELYDRADLNWNGMWFEQRPFTFTVDGFFDPSYFESCWSIIRRISGEADPQSNINLTQVVLKSRPSLESKDELRYRLGLYQALVGNSSEAIATFNDLITSPTVITSTWVAPAQQFLDVYKTPDDLYRACAQAPLCEPRFAIEQVTRTLPRESFPLALDELRERGVPIAASGLFGFDGEGEAEHWFTVRHPGQSKTELWIVARTPEGMKALRVSEVTGTPSFVRLNSGGDARATIQVKAGGAESFFTFVRAPGTREPFVAVIETTSTPPVTAATLISAATDDLFAGADPATVRAVLLKAKGSHDFDCKTVDCPQVEYLLGLTYELSGDEREAVETYLNLWRNYPDSPYTIMARAKLELAP